MPTAGRKSSIEARRRVAELERELAACREREAEAREQQAATSEILRAIASAPGDPQAVLDTIAERAAHLCDTYAATILRVDGDVLIGIAHYGFGPLMVGTPAHGPVRHPAHAVSRGRLPIRGSFAGRAVLDRKTVHISDAATASAEEFPIGVANQPLTGQRTTLVTPLLRDGEPLGVIMVRRREVRPFTDEQIRLLETFADQAVIAIENARLFDELERRNRELQESNRQVGEALEQQTATAEILRIIASSPADLQPVLDAVAESAARLCETENVWILRLEGDHLTKSAAYGAWATDVDLADGLPLNRGSLSGRSVIDRRTVHVHDLAAVSEAEFPEGRDLQRRFGQRTALSTPLMLRGAAIGTIGAFHLDVRPFTAKQIELLETFADQAVIAIENARLFQELERRNRELQESNRQVTEALEQQTATAEVLKIISRSAFELQPVLDTLVENAVRLGGANSGWIYRLDGELFRPAAAYGLSAELLKFVEEHPFSPGRGTGTGRAALERRTIHIPDVFADPEYEHPARQFAEGFRTLIAIPMLRGDELVGVFSIVRLEPEPFSDRQIELLETFADQAVIAIENVRLFQELEKRNRALSEALEQQTSTAEILRVIASSPTDLQAVLDAVAENAARVCGANDANIFRLDDEGLLGVAEYGSLPKAAAGFRFPVSRGSAVGRAVVDRHTIHVYDMQEATSEFPDARMLVERVGARTVLATPLLREGVPIGGIVILRNEPRPFTDKQIELLETFADQAVIAIENTRLFQELEQRNSDLTEALEQQTATGEILRVIASSPTDLQRVLSTIAESAAYLSRSSYSVIFQVDGDELVMPVKFGDAPFTFIGSRRPIDRSSVTGRAVVDRRTVHVHDLVTESEDEYPLGKATQREAGQRTVLATPLMREGVPIGAINIARLEVLPYTDQQIALIETFADQAVIAIENTRLFEELEGRNRELTEALEQQTATSEILRVIASAPTSLDMVLDTLVRRAARLTNADEAAILQIEGSTLPVVASTSGHPAISANAVMPLSERSVSGRAIRERRAIIADEPREEHEAKYPASVMHKAGFQAEVVVPLLHGDVVLGTLIVFRRERLTFDERQVDLLETFADQAVIAIENARLFRELRDRNRDLTEALEQQTATSEILRVIASSPTDLQSVLDTVAENAARLCDTQHALIFRVDGDVLRPTALYLANGDRTGMLRPTPLRRDSVPARAVLDRRTLHVHDIAAESEFPLTKAIAAEVGHRTILATPLLRENVALGAIMVRRAEVRPFTDQQIRLLETFADQAAIAIENARLFQQLEERNRDLAEALEQQTATSEVLKLISRSAFDLQPILETLVENAATLCNAEGGYLYTLDAEVFQPAVAYRAAPGLMDFVKENPIRPGRGSVVGRVALDKRTVHITDVLDDPEYQLQDTQRVGGYRTLLGVPMLRDGVLVGAFALTRNEVKAFTERQIELAETFADQAVIAVENTRLLRELQERTGELVRSVEELRALSDVSQAVSSSLDLEEVLNTIVAQAVQLSGADGGTVYQFEEDTREFVLCTAYRMDDDLLATIRETRPRLDHTTVIGRAALSGEAVQVADILEESPSPIIASLRRSGFRALLAVPVIREQRIVGAIVIRRKTPGEFPQAVVELLQTFASQSVLAIENARLFQEVEEKGRELAVASKHKSEFLANMSHELRTPLNAILSYSQLLREEAEDTGQDESIADLDKIHAAGEHLLRLINDILDLSKIEAGRMDLYLETFDVPTMVHEAVAVVRPLVEKNGNTLVVECAADLGTMHADQVKVRQALLNLLSNAAKFTEQGTVTLAVRRGSGDGLISFAVSDTGIGMTEEQLGRLFEAFSQADSSTTRRYGGTGLGLAISRHFCRLMGGDVQVESEPARGSTFTITLPVDVQIHHGRQGDSADVDGRSGIQPPADPTLPTILVVDDDPTVRELMQRFLRSAGFNIVTAAGGEEGLRLAREVRPDAITLDVMMPGMDGWAMLAALKADPGLADIPVTMLTIVEDRSMGYALGAADYLTKPIDRERLVAALTKYRRDRAPRDVLIVEDDPATRETVRRALEHEDWTVAEAENGKAALAAVAVRRPSVILLDLMMPEMDGFEFIGELRARPEWRDFPIVVMTAKDLTEEDRQRLNGYIMAIVQKAASSRDVFLSEVRDQLATSLRHARSP